MLPTKYWAPTLGKHGRDRLSMVSTRQPLSLWSRLPPGSSLCGLSAWWQPQLLGSANTIAFLCPFSARDHSSSNFQLWLIWVGPLFPIWLFSFSKTLVTSSACSFPLLNCLVWVLFSWQRHIGNSASYITVSSPPAKPPAAGHQSDVEKYNPNSVTPPPESNSGLPSPSFSAPHFRPFAPWGRLPLVSLSPFPWRHPVVLPSQTAHQSLG